MKTFAELGFDVKASEKKIDERWDELETYSHDQLVSEVKEMELIEAQCQLAIDDTEDFTAGLPDDRSKLVKRSKALCEILDAMMNRQGLNLQLSMNADPKMKSNFNRKRKESMPV